MYTSASSPAWANAAQSALNLMVVFPHIGVEPVPFTATADDAADHGRELYARAVAGDFGPIAPFVAPPLTMADYSRAIQSHIDAAAKQREYGSAVAAASYATSKNVKWKAEAETFIDWRDAVWTYVYEQLALVQSGQRTQPTIAEFIVELPAIAWPA